MLEFQPGESVVDIGPGPGYLSEEIATLVGPSGRVVGVDRSPDMLAVARGRCAKLPQVSFQEADATRLPLPSGEFDAAIAVQVYEYVADMESALGELHRVLRPGGRAVIVDIDWASLVWEAEDRQRAERIFKAWDEHLTDPNLPRRLPSLLRGAGFDSIRVDTCAPVAIAPDSFVTGLAKFIANFVPGRRGVTAEEANAWLADLAAAESRGNYFFSLIAFIFLARRNRG